MTNLMIYIVFPLILSNIVHIVMVKKSVFSFLTKPISTSLFGQNKTWRGFAIVPLLNACILLTINLIVPYYSLKKAFIIGFLMGIAYMLFELPNSFLKRRLGIKAGEEADKHKELFMLLDKTDSSFGVSLLSYFLLNLSLLQTLQLFIISISTHIFFSWLLVIIKIKKRF